MNKSEQLLSISEVKTELSKVIFQDSEEFNKVVNHFKDELISVDHSSLTVVVDFDTLKKVEAYSKDYKVVFNIE